MLFVTKLIVPFGGGTLVETACNMITIIHMQIFMLFLERVAPLLQLGYCLLRVQKIS